MSSALVFWGVLGLGMGMYLIGYYDGRRSAMPRRQRRAHAQRSSGHVQVRCTRRPYDYQREAQL